MTTHTTMTLSGPRGYVEDGVCKCWIYFSCEASVQTGDGLDAYVTLAQLIPEGMAVPDEIYIDKTNVAMYGPQTPNAGHFMVGVWDIEAAPYVVLAEVFEGNYERVEADFPDECMWMDADSRLRFNGSTVVQAAGYNPVGSSPSYTRYWVCSMWYRFDVVAP